LTPRTCGSGSRCTAFLGLYTDWKNVYVQAATEAERAQAVIPRTQFGRMCEALDTQIIPPNSPQAKGWIGDISNEL